MQVETVTSTIGRKFRRRPLSLALVCAVLIGVIVVFSEFQASLRKDHQESVRSINYAYSEALNNRIELFRRSVEQFIHEVQRIQETTNQGIDPYAFYNPTIPLPLWIGSREADNASFQATTITRSQLDQKAVSRFESIPWTERVSIYFDDAQRGTLPLLGLSAARKSQILVLYDATEVATWLVTVKFIASGSSLTFGDKVLDQSELQADNYGWQSDKVISLDKSLPVTLRFATLESLSQGYLLWIFVIPFTFGILVLSFALKRLGKSEQQNQKETATLTHLISQYQGEIFEIDPNHFHDPFVSTLALEVKLAMERTHRRIGTIRKNAARARFLFSLVDHALRSHEIKGFISDLVRDCNTFLGKATISIYEPSAFSDLGDDQSHLLKRHIHCRSSGTRLGTVVISGSESDLSPSFRIFMEHLCITLEVALDRYTRETSTLELTRQAKITELQSAVERHIDFKHETKELIDVASVGRHQGRSWRMIKKIPNTEGGFFICSLEGNHSLVENATLLSVAVGALREFLLRALKNQFDSDQLLIEIATMLDQIVTRIGKKVVPACFMIFNVKTKQLTLLNAGHLAPIAFDATNKHVRILINRGSRLGSAHAHSWAIRRFPLTKEEVMILLSSETLFAARRSHKLASSHDYLEAQLKTVSSRKAKDILDFLDDTFGNNDNLWAFSQHTSKESQNITAA